ARHPDPKSSRVLGCLPPLFLIGCLAVTAVGRFVGWQPTDEAVAPGGDVLAALCRGNMIGTQALARRTSNYGLFATYEVLASDRWTWDDPPTARVVRPLGLSAHAR